MTDNIWTSYAERKPTKEDADKFGDVLVLWSDGPITATGWDGPYDDLDSWARTADVLRATGYVKPRKLHSAWRQPWEADWKGPKSLWLADDKRDCWHDYVHAETVKISGYFWQPCDPPKVWEDE